MSRVRIHNFSISLDGFATGEGQALDTPFGHAGHRLHEWMFATRFARREILGESGGTEGVDDAMAERHGPGIGAEIMGASKFGPPGWQDDPEWRGWWGDNPPFHTPTYVLTHRPRPSLEMEGGTTFHFLDAAPADALEVARTRPPVRTSASAAARPWCASSSPPVSSTTCTSCWCRSCSAAVFGCGTAWRGWSSSTTWRRSRRPAASPTSRSPDDLGLSASPECTCMCSMLPSSPCHVSDQLCLEILVAVHEARFTDRARRVASGCCAGVDDHADDEDGRPAMMAATGSMTARVTHPARPTTRDP